MLKLPKNAENHTKIKYSTYIYIWSNVGFERESVRSCLKTLNSEHIYLFRVYKTTSKKKTNDHIINASLVKKRTGRCSLTISKIDKWHNFYSLNWEIVYLVCVANWHGQTQTFTNL